MLPATRLLRAHADDLPNARPHLSGRERDREDKIVAAAQALIARFGRTALTMGNFAIAVRMSPATIRRHFPDIDSILAEILFRHLLAISKAIGEAKSDPRAPHKARRAAYLAMTRTAFNAPTERHLLLLRERQSLPADLAATVDELRTGIGEMLAGDFGPTALALLDTPELQAPQIEAMLATLARKMEPPRIGAARQARPAAKLHLVQPRTGMEATPAAETDPEEPDPDDDTGPPQARAGPLH